MVKSRMAKGALAHLSAKPSSVSLLQGKPIQHVVEQYEAANLLSS